MKIGKVTIFAFKNAFRRKIVAILAIVGISVAITMQVTINSFTTGMDETFNDIFGELMGTFQLQEKDSPVSYASQLPTNITETIMSFENSSLINSVATEQNLPATVNNYTDILGETTFGTPMGISIRGIENIDLFSEVYSELEELTNGSREFEYNKDECIIPYALYKNNSEVFDIGKTFSLMINSSYTYDLEIVGITAAAVGGIMQSIMVTGYDIYVPINVTNAVLFELLRNDTMNHMFHYTPFGLDPSHFGTHNPNVVAVRTTIDNSEDIEVFIEELTVYLEDQYPEKEFSTLSLASALSSMDDMMETQTIVIGIVAIVVIIAGSMGVIIAQLVGVEGRSKEFAILKATGWKEGHIIYSVIVESITLGVVGSIVGLILSWLSIKGLESAMSFGDAGMPFSPVITFSIVMTAVGTAVGIGILGGLYPGIKASSVKPMEVLQGS
ncbi:MAG: ABC transporter permease [Candidatus Heimdallarchaeota archaeon]|nr:ABC transporter permease [Candidatus Heimdallarchaeota archaeon]